MSFKHSLIDWSVRQLADGRIGRITPRPFLTGLSLGILLAVFAFRINPFTHSPITPAAQATVGTLTIDQSVSGDATLGIVTAQKLVDTANASYFIDPAATGNSLVIAGNGTLVTTTTTNLKITGQSSAPSSPSEGQVYYNSTDKEFYGYKNAQWTKLTAAAQGSCPTGYILVPGSATFGTNDFCVMKYEAKQDANKNPTSTATGSPWVSVDWYEAKTACGRVGAHLITNAEWMTVARNIESTTINDMDDDAGVQMATGHSDNAPANSLATTAGADPVVSGCTLTATQENAANVYSASSCEIRGNGAGGSTDADKGYYGTGQTWATTGYSAGAANKSQLRTAVLSNGQVIWDIAGGVWEWSDWQCTSGGPWYNVAGWIEWNNANLTDYEAYAGGSLTNISTNGAGQYYACTATGNAARRSGAWDYGATDGPFTLNLNNAPADVATSLGFRCAK